jgi:hypothetical protein
MRVRIKRDQQERISFKHKTGRGGMRPRAWFASAWRLIDEEGDDQLFPWANSRKEARDVAKSRGWTVISEDR